MSVVYFISVILLFLSLMFLKKVDRKINLVVSIVFSMCIIYFFDVLVAFGLSILNIKNTLFMFSAVNFITTLIIYFVHRRKYGKLVIQEFSINKKELICFGILIILCILFGAFRYSGFTSTSYRISDAAVHYKMSYDYSTYQKLFDKAYSDLFYDFKNSMFGYYVPCGIFMEILPFNGPVCFNIFNTFFLCLLVVSFYAIILVMKKDDKHNVFKFLLTLLYGFAYPVNYTLFGFGYLGPGILATTLIILTWKLILNYDKKYLYYVLFLFNFGLFVSYYLFVPAVFLAEGLFGIFLFIEGKLKFLEFLKYGFISLIIPTLLGFFYLIYHGLGASGAINSYSIDGYSYKNLISNFVLLIPLVTIAIIEQAKKKIFDFDLAFIICEVLYIVGTFTFIGNGYVSPYYFYKSYYILWIVTNLFVFKLVSLDNYKLLIKVMYALIILCIFFSIFDVEKMVDEKSKDFVYSGTVHSLGDIYSFNYGMLSDSLVISKEEIDLILSVSKHSKECGINSKNRDLPYLNQYSQRRWYYMITGIVPAMNYKKGDYMDVYTKSFNYDEFIKSDTVKCITVSDNFMRDVGDSFQIDYSQFDILFKNKSGSLIKKKS